MVLWGLSPLSHTHTDAACVCVYVHSPNNAPRPPNDARMVGKRKRKRTVHESVSMMERMSWSAFTSRARGCLSCACVCVV